MSDVHLQRQAASYWVLPSEEGTDLKGFQDFHTKSGPGNLAPTVLCMPFSLDSGGSWFEVQIRLHCSRSREKNSPARLLAP